MYRLPDCPKWHPKLILKIACFDGEPSAEEVAAVSGYKPSSTEVYLRAMARAGLVIASRHVDEDGFRAPTTYRLAEAGERMFDHIVTVDEAFKRANRRQGAARRAIDKRSAELHGRAGRAKT